MLMLMMFEPMKSKESEDGKSILRKVCKSFLDVNILLDDSRQVFSQRNRSESEQDCLLLVYGDRDDRDEGMK